MSLIIICVVSENLRTLGGSNRITKRRVGWHYRNQNMRAEEVLFKYLNYGHPEESPLTTFFNISSTDMNSSHILREQQRDCSVRTPLIKEVRMKVDQLPAMLQDVRQRERFRHLFFDYDGFYEMLGRNSEAS